ncbi:hypothetical protein GCM10025863_22720 [Microbacterium suwonense]|uniref:Uncharacterized protein n=1 Tax=Microbacterium suwonense TaxID=683047 RepID=A0ABN6X4D9_9MICO|nr:hypothetical protein GCM10025863_22720 [Microbacterium suwonense]
MVRSVASTGLGAVADAARLVAAGALGIGPAALGGRGARLGRTVPAVLGADAAGPTIRGAALAGIRASIVVASWTSAGMTVVERRLLRVPGLEIAGRASALGLAVLGHGVS